MSKKIFKFCVDNVPLSVNYYKEYLGFSFVESNQELDHKSSAKMCFKDNVIFFVKSNDTDNFINREITFQVNLTDVQMKQLYNNYKQKLRINNVLINNECEITRFSIKDCDGNILGFESNLCKS